MPTTQYKNVVTGTTPDGKPIYSSGVGTAPQPIVQPTTPGSLQGTMTTPQAPVTPTSQVGTQPVPTKTDPMAFNQVISAMRDKLAQDDKLTKVKNLVYTQLYDRPLTDEEKASLTPGLQHAMQTGDRNLMDFEIRTINDQIKGRADSLDSSLKYLVDGYQTSVAQAEKQKQDAENNIQWYLSNYGKGIVPFLKTKYPDSASVIDQLAGVQTLNERQENRLSSGSNSSTPTANELKVFINKQMATPEFKALSDEDKASYIQSQGGTASDFGY